MSKFKYSIYWDDEFERYVAVAEGVDVLGAGDTPEEALSKLRDKISAVGGQFYQIEIHLGAPYAAKYSECIYCGEPATRTITMNGSITNLDTGDKMGFTKNNHKICVCNKHGIIRKNVYWSKR